jgi:transposase-like protein
MEYTIYVRKNGKVEERVVFGYNCPFCSASYWAEQNELDEFETYTCPKCHDDVYFEDAIPA